MARRIVDFISGVTYALEVMSRKSEEYSVYSQQYFNNSSIQKRTERTSGTFFLKVIC
jgi:hypothetical protein